jgi:putative FmdB family regulatory protein
MPIYEYKCPKCDSEFECLVLGSGDDISCPDCNGKNVERLMSACSFKSAGGYSDSSAASSSSSCAGCTSGSCAGCH